MVLKRSIKKKYDLIVVMPVYNEEECIQDVVEDWLDELSVLELNFKIILLNDGSTDGTKEWLEHCFSSDKRVEIIDKPNSGHGPTILQGYKKAIDEAKWVFQCDSDNEMSSRGFHEMWARSSVYKAVFGIRQGREQDLGRGFISAISRVVTKICFGSKVSDVNVPYRLISAELLRGLIKDIPDDTLTPNIIISGMLSKLDAKVFEILVPHKSRETGEVSIVKWKLWKFAFKAFWQVLEFWRGYDEK